MATKAVSFLVLALLLLAVAFPAVSSPRIASGLLVSAISRALRSVCVFEFLKFKPGGSPADRLFLVLCLVSGRRWRLVATGKAKATGTGMAAAT